MMPWGDSFTTSYISAPIMKPNATMTLRTASVFIVRDKMNARGTLHNHPKSWQCLLLEFNITHRCAVYTQQSPYHVILLFKCSEQCFI